MTPAGASGATAGDRLIRAIDRLSTVAGWLAGALIVPMTLAMAYEVVARYAFNAPTRWASGISTMLYGSQFMLAAAYTLLQGGHIRTDVFYERWAPRTRALVDAVAYVVFFFPALVFILYAGAEMAHHAWLIGERGPGGPAYRFKAVIPVTAALLLLQGLSELIKSVRVIRGTAR